MKIGLIADTHDRMSHIEKAVDALVEARVDRVLHAGDYVAPFALRPLARLPVSWFGVFGNNDGERRGLAKTSENRIEGDVRRFEWAGRTIVLIHDEQQYFSADPEEGGSTKPTSANVSAHGERDVDVVVCGHTHEFKVERRGSLWVVNPGECCGYLGAQSTVAVLDTDDLSVERIVLTG
jgi:hypothetical protein